MHYLIASLPIIFYGLALVLGLAGIQPPFASPELSPLAQWMLALSLGLISLWAGASHLAFTDRVASSIGWEPSPFQHEVGPILASDLGLSLRPYSERERPGPFSLSPPAFSGPRLWCM